MDWKRWPSEGQPFSVCVSLCCSCADFSPFDQSLFNVRRHHRSGPYPSRRSGCRVTARVAIRGSAPRCLRGMFLECRWISSAPSPLAQTTRRQPPKRYSPVRDEEMARWMAALSPRRTEMQQSTLFGRDRWCRRIRSWIELHMPLPSVSGSARSLCHGRLHAAIRDGTHVSAAAGMTRCAYFGRARGASTIMHDEQGPTRPRDRRRRCSAATDRRAPASGIVGRPLRR